MKELGLEWSSKIIFHDKLPTFVLFRIILVALNNARVYEPSCLNCKDGVDNCLKLSYELVLLSITVHMAVSAVISLAVRSRCRGV